MPTTIATLRARVRQDLRDEDAANYRWTDAHLDRHLDRAVREHSEHVPREQKSTLATTNGSRDLSVSALTPLLGLEAVEYPTGSYPPAFVPFSLWQTTLTLLVDAVPTGGNAVLYWLTTHILDASQSTLPPQHEDIVAGGAAGYAALEWANYAVNTVNVGGENVDRDYRSWGLERLAQFRRELSRVGRRNTVRRRRLYVPDTPASSKSLVEGP